MKVAVQCPDCGKSYRIGDESLGTRAQCKSCGQTFVIALDETVSPRVQKAVGSGQVEPSAREARRVPKKIGQYVLRRKLGAGAMGEVYLAHDPDLDREVAIKVLPETFSSDEDRLKRFLREARLAARVHHTNAVTVYQVGASGGLAYIAMEYVAGLPLDHTVGKQGALAWRKATQVVRDAAAGLSAAHKLGVFHRDVKPGNLMLSSDGTAKVVDFGLARAQEMDSGLTQQGTLLGTPAYMAPEQWMGKEVDGRSDLYALACTYFYLLTGRVPFDAPSLPSLGYQHRHEPLPDPRDLTVHIPDEACRILLRAAAKNPEDRFQTADELASELDVLLGCPDEMLSFGALWSDFGGLFAAGPQSTSASSGAFPSFGAPAGEFLPSASAYALPALQPVGKASRSSLPPWVWIASSGVAAALLLLLGAVIIFSTKYGQVQITLNDATENVEITIDGDTISIDGLEKPLEIKVGAHDLVASSPDFETVTRSFQVKRNEVTVVDVMFVPKAAPVEPPAESIAAIVPEPIVPEAVVPAPVLATPSNSPTAEPPSVASNEPKLTEMSSGSIGEILELTAAGKALPPEKLTGLPTFSSAPTWLTGAKEIVPTIVYDPKDGSYRAWYCSGLGNNRFHTISTATSADGLHWTDNQEVTFEGISYAGQYDSLREPTVWLENGRYRMWLGEGNRGHAWSGWAVHFESTDGINWSGYRPVLKTVANGWENFDVSPVAILKLQNQYTMYYRGRPNTESGTCRIGATTSTDGLSFGDRKGILTERWTCEVLATNGEPPFYMLTAEEGDLAYAKSNDGLQWGEPTLLLARTQDVRYFFDPGSSNSYFYYSEAADDTGKENILWRRQLPTVQSMAPGEAMAADTLPVQIPKPDDGAAISGSPLPDKSEKPDVALNNSSESSWAYLVRRPVNGIVTTSPESTIREHGVPLTAVQARAVSQKDNEFLSEGTYHLFKFPNKAASRIQWTGYGTGNAQISLRCWDGSEFILQDNRDTRTNTTCTILINQTDRRSGRLSNTADTIVNIPRTEEFIYVMVNCTSGAVFTDAISND